MQLISIHASDFISRDLRRVPPNRELELEAEYLELPENLR